MASDMKNEFREAGSKNLKSSEASETQESFVNHRDKGRKGLRMTRTFSSPDISPFDQLEWEKREALITDETGNVIFNQKGAEVSKSWSQLATNVVASKYFYGEMGTPERERSVRQLIHRVTRTIADWGKRDGYFYSDEDAEIFYDDLSFLCLNQYGAFNSPVWFNVGLYHQYGIAGTKGGYYYDRLEHTAKRSETSYEYPQGSACFIQSVEDNMEDIMRLATSEAMLFKYGSGTGTDLSTIRSSKEKLSGGGKPSGPISFMRVYDQIAAVVKSGGKTRRAAKMQTLQVWHPDIVEFINCKPNEEKKAWSLIEQGYDGSYNGESYNSIMFQNANLSVRVSDEFMKAALEDKEWHTRAVTTGEIVDTYKARDLLRMMAEGAHVCGDPGIQYDTTINKWHTCPSSGRINSSNPCSEFMFLDETACNLASLNLMKFRKLDGSFDVEKFERAVEIFITAQEIIVDNASYPTSKIAEKSHQFRPLGLGYANLGALIMSMGLPYDSDQGRACAAAITAIMTGHAYYLSSQIAKAVGPFEGYQVNRDPMLRVIRMHRDAAYNIDSVNRPDEIYRAACDVWDRALESGIEYGYRNSQVTVLAPTGTISFMMDCDTTGIEPDIALVKYKLLAGGGLFKIVNKTVPEALAKLGYTEKQVDDIIKYIEKQDTIEGAPHMKDEHLPVFDCAFKPFNGTRSIQHMAHLKMMATVQPFLSGAISKTINMPKESTVEDIMDAYIEGWMLGLKAVAIYRDGSKRSQPLSTSLKSESAEAAPKPVRKRLPATRKSITHKFEIQGHEGYFTVGFYEDGTPGELFITMAKEGSTIGGLMDAFGTAVSLGLQYGVPLKALVDKFVNSHFEPSGYTSSPEIPLAKSIVDYIFRWLGIHFVEGYAELMSKTAIEASLVAAEEQVQSHALKSDDSDSSDKSDKSDKSESKSASNGTVRKIKRIDDQFAHFQDDAPICDSCGAITVRNGACYKCYNCGNAIGCS